MILREIRKLNKLFTEKALHFKAKKRTTTMIQLKNIEKVYRTDTIETLALTNINLDILRGEF